jgi:hypothetical protein
MDLQRLEAYRQGMTSEPSVRTTAETLQTPSDCRLHQSLCWGAVVAGTVAAIAIHLLLIALSAGAGLAIFRPMTAANPAATFSSGAAFAWSLFAIISVSLGGWVAGRFSRCVRSGLLHGVLVWSLTLIIALPWLALGTGLALRRAMKDHGEVLRISRQSVAAAEEDLAKSAAKRSQNQMASFVQEAVQSIPTNATPKADTRAEREVGFALEKLFAPVNAAAFSANRQEAINVLMVYTEMSAAEATTSMDAWIASHKNLQAELDMVKVETSNLKAVVEQQASAETDALSSQRAQHLARLGKWSFLSLLIGLLGAALGGRCGAKCACRNPGSV